MEKIVMKEEVWSAATLEVTVNGIGVREQIRASGQQIIDCVVAGRLAVDDVRSCARWTGQLAHEAVLAAEHGAEWNNEERLEAAARQILHGSVSAALNKVKTEDRLMAQRVRQSLRRDFAGQA